MGFAPDRWHLVVHGIAENVLDRGQQRGGDRTMMFRFDVRVVMSLGDPFDRASRRLTRRRH